MIVQADIGSTQQVSSPKYLIFTYQTQNRKGVPVKKIDVAIFDKLDPRKYHVEIDGQRYPRDSVNKNYEGNAYNE